jgi:hypothetical protein
MSSRLRSLAPLVAIGLLATGTVAGDSLPLRVLFVGNSYTYHNDLPRILQQLAVAAEQDRLPEVRGVTLPDYTLADHWLGEASEAIRQGTWDFVVLQEQSTLPITHPDTLLHYGSKLAEEISARGAQPLLFVTWAHKTRPTSQDTLTEAYRKLARATGATVAPVGPAWEVVMQRHPDIPLHMSDGSHPTPEGSYLSACVFYAVLYGSSPVGLPRVSFETVYPLRRIRPVRLAPDRAEILQSVAWVTVSTLRADDRD